jgi:hypothetical protein
MHLAEDGGLMRASLLRLAAGFIVVTLAAIACRQGDPAIDPRTPPNSPVPTKLDRPDDPPSSPSIPRLVPDGGATR